MNAVTDAYLSEVDGQEREKEALRQFCATPFLLDELLGALALPEGFRRASWATLAAVMPVGIGLALVLSTLPPNMGSKGLIGRDQPT